MSLRKATGGWLSKGCHALGLRAGAVGALGLLFVVPSELWFYPVALDAGLPLMVVAYGLCGWAAVSTLRAFGRDDPAGWWLAAVLFGCLVEGVVVGQLYEVPGFSLVWTPIAWHALVTVHAGHRWLRRWRGWRAAVGAAALGAGVGVWGAWYRNLAPLPEWVAPEGWAPVGPFATQMAAGGVLWYAGHRAWDWVEPRLAGTDPRRDAAALGVFASAAWAAGHAAPSFPTSLTLPLVAGATLLALARAPRTPGSPEGPGRPGRPSDRGGAVGAPRRRVPGSVLLAVPAVAIGAYAVATAGRWVWPANVAAVLLCGGVGVVCWVRAFCAGGRPGRGAWRGPRGPRARSAE